MARAFIGLGSNLGDGRQNLLLAWRKLQEEAGVALALSPPFLTEPVGMKSDFLFTNAVGILETELTPDVLLEKMLAVEALLGRDRQKGKDRTVDLDLLYYDDVVMKKHALSLPHPEIENRLFVLAPLANVAPDHIHPVLGQTTREMLEKRADTTACRQIVWEGK